ncbi:MAG: spermidine/putrescine ABC transporter substrate-binding protein [Candidatus Aenigmatarchaeota archaeon]
MVKLKTIIFFVLLLSIIVLTSGCIDNISEPAKKLSSELNILNWEDYFYPNFIEEFHEKYGVTINIFTFDEEDYMISELETKPGSYDFVIASDAVVRDLIAVKALAPIDKNNIPNLNNLDHSFLDKSFDPDNKYSIPYLWGTTGIAYNASAVSENVTSWSSLWDDSFAGRIAMIDNKDEVIGVALNYLGYSINPTNLSQLSEAEKILIEQKDIITGYFGSRDIVDGLISGSFVISLCYNGDALYASERNEDIVYTIPDEGAALWIDCMVIPVDSPHKYTAEIFINYLLEPHVSANITNYQWYANPNMAAKPYIDDEILDNEGVFLSDDILENCEFFEVLDSGLVNEMNHIWSHLQK